MISLNIPLLGLHALSRSSTVQYLLTYFMFLIYIFPVLNKKVRGKIIKSSFLGFGAIIFSLGIITSSRFSEYYNVPPESKIKNTILYSLFDYASQWNRNGIVVMKEFSHDKLSFGRQTVPLVSFVGERIGIEFENITVARKRNFGKYSSAFNGVVAALLYDFGYIFTFIFAFLYYEIVKRNSPNNGEVSLKKFINFAVLIPLPLLFFGNNAYSSLSLNIGIIYLLIFHLLVRFSK